jgi:hypothetical protein
MNELIRSLFQQKKYPVTIIVGNTFTGKTDFALLLFEMGKRDGALDYLGANFDTFGHGNHIPNMMKLKHWLRTQNGRKLFILDEAGIHDDTRAAMKRLTNEIRHLVFIIRKFECRIIFVLQELEDIDKWKSSALTGAIITKDSVGGKFSAEIESVFLGEKIILDNIPRTTIPFKTDDIAEFTLGEEWDWETDQMQVEGLPAKAAFMYAKVGNTSTIARKFAKELGKPCQPMQVKRLIQAYLREQFNIKLRHRPPMLLNANPVNE